MATRSAKTKRSQKRKKPSSKPYIIFGSPAIGSEEASAAASVIRSKWIGTGPRTKQFEGVLCKYTGSQNGCAVNSCTAAIHLALAAIGLEPGDEVITTPMTFCASANVIIHAGGVPTFVDVDRETMNIDPEKIEAAITPKTKAILPVHMAGRPCEMDAIFEIARKYKLKVIEDAAHALGATYKGEQIGNLKGTTATCFSFYATKNITTAEGGMLMTPDTELADHVRVLALHGMSKDAWKRYSPSGYSHYQVVVPGYKYNMTDIAAAIGIEQMKKMRRFDKRRAAIWKQYDKAFKNLPITLPAPIAAHMTHARHLYTILIDKERTGVSRDEFMQAMHEEGVGTGVHFRPVHLHEYYRERFGYSEGTFPEAEYIGERTVSIPLSSALSDAEVARIIKAVQGIIHSAKHHG